jgi:hypothetical protein
MTKKKEVATTEAGLTTQDHAAMMDMFGAAPVSSNDVIIPKIRVMQPGSQLVTDGVAKFGDFIDSLSNEVVGHITEKAVELIPFYVEKIWIISKWNGSKFEFDRIEGVTPMNENKQWEEDTPQGKFKNEKCFNFYCLRPEDMSLPVIVAFKGTSLRAGRELMTQMYVKNKAAGKAPCAKVINLGGDKTSNDKGTYAVMKASVSRDTSMEEMTQCLNWFKSVQSGEAKADNSDIENKPEAPVQEVNPQF